MRRLQKTKANGLILSKDTSTPHQPLEELFELVDIPEWKQNIIRKCCVYTVTSFNAILDLIDSAEDILTRDIPGDFVECGVFMGGSSMIMAEVLKHFNSTRTLWLFDTFDGVPMPNETELTHSGENLKDWYVDNMIEMETGKSDWCYTTLDVVKENIAICDYDNMQFIVGRVEDTIPSIGPINIALLRIDVDLVDPTRHILEQFYPRLTTSGYLILDDYGHFPGIKKTVDDYFKHTPTEIIDVDKTVKRIIK